MRQWTGRSAVGTDDCARNNGNNNRVTAFSVLSMPVLRAGQLVERVQLSEMQASEELVSE
jgi:hypothetical protein